MVTDIKRDTIFLLGNVWVTLNSDFHSFEVLEILTTLELHPGEEAKSLMKCVWYFWHGLDFRIQRTCQFIRINKQTKKHSETENIHLLKP